MNPFQKLQDKFHNMSNHRVIKNTFMLMLLQFSTIAMTVVTSGYQARVLGRVNNGILGLAFATTSFFQLFIDFGFTLSATGKIASNQKDRSYVSKIFTSVTISKIILILISTLVMLFFFQPSFSSFEESAAYWLYFLSVIGLALLPDYVYRGLENMTVITVRAISIKIFSTIMIFVFMRQENDYYMVPLFTALGNFAAVFVVYSHLAKKMGIRLTKVSAKETFSELKDSSRFFLSRIATTAYSQLNTVVMGKIYPTEAHAGYYNNAQVVINAARTGLVAPIADSMYPHMMTHKSFKLIKKTLTITFPILILGCTGVFLLAGPICSLWLGTDIGPEVVSPLRALLPVVVISLPNYMCGFPTLAPMGLVKHANNSVIFGSIVHIILMGILYATGNLNIISICLLTGFTELIILIYRIIVIWKYRHLMQEDGSIATK